jgi:pyruvate/2-oxoglutarate dehydrogenase complex dihydrolipoamide dehydrogenase (E3) component
LTFVHPLDDANRRLLDQVRPAGWRVHARPQYDLIVIGGGTAGLVTAMGAAGLGARVALVERGLLGGDCLNVGCVPSKAVLRSARAVREVRTAAAFGIRVEARRADFGAVMARMRERRASLAQHDSAARLAAAGVDVFFGTAAFADPRHIVVDGTRLRFLRAVIATGGRPIAPPVPGLAESSYLTNENVFWLTNLPERLLVIGAGPIGCEMAQALALLGSEVTVVDVADRVLPREDADASAIVSRRMRDDGVHFELGVRLTEVRRVARGASVAWERDGRRSDVVVDAILVAAGRAPNIEELNLEAAGVRAGKEGVEVDDRMRTSNPRIYAAGDVASPFKFTHAADAMARLVIQNALFFGRRRVSSLVIPWCTYTFPEVAHAGITADEARNAGRRVATTTVPFANVDRAVLDEETDGFVRIQHERGAIRGCTIVGPHAGELIGHVAYVMQTRGGLNDLSAAIFPYPTYAEALRKAGDAWRRSRLTPRVKRLFELYFSLRRGRT